MKTKEKPVSFTQLFKQKRLVKKLSNEYNKQSCEMKKNITKKSNPKVEHIPYEP